MISPFNLMISPFQVIVFLLMFVSLIITSLVLASKNEIRFNFLVWSLIILFVPFLGSISYLIKHYTSSKTKTNNLVS